MGSGVIVSSEGYVLTNNHVVEGAEQIEIVLHDGRRTQAQVIGTDPDTDLAVLKIKLDKLPVIVWGNSDELQVGDRLLGIIGGYIRWSGMVDDPSQAIIITERIGGRQLDTWARELILNVHTLR
jgi:hypothetical protein